MDDLTHRWVLCAQITEHGMIVRLTRPGPVRWQPGLCQRGTPHSWHRVD
jgi:hypothetical protein